MKQGSGKFAIYFSVLLFSLGVFFADLGYPQSEVAKYPNQPITFISPNSPGASAELACRLMAKTAEKFLGQPIPFVNKTGGGLTIGCAAIASAKPDGYTIGYTATSPIVIVPFLEKLPYKGPEDFTQIMQFAEVNFGVIVRPNSPFKSFSDLISYARKNPQKKLTYGSATAISQLTVEQIAKKEGIQFTLIPFKGSPETEAALLGGHIDFSATGFSNAQIDAGQTRLLLLFSEQRRTEYPEIPILKDLGYYFPAPMYINIAGPKGLPKEILKKLEDSFTQAMKEPSFIKGMKDIQLPIVYRNSQELTDYVAQSYDLFGKLLKEYGLAK